MKNEAPKINAFITRRLDDEGFFVVDDVEGSIVIVVGWVSGKI